ncbi:MAG: radical SAM protein, partial [Vicinamibacterales bacterium]
MNTLTDAQLVVSSDVAALLDRASEGAWTVSNEEREALDLLRENGFLVKDRAEDRRALDTYLSSVKSSTDELNVTLLTTLQCNFACDYCFQGDHGDYNLHAEKMSLETAARVGDWLERELERVRPERFVFTFFGGEPLLNLPVMYQLSERLWRVTQASGVTMYVNIITNGLLLT